MAFPPTIGAYRGPSARLAFSALVSSTKIAPSALSRPCCFYDVVAAAVASTSCCYEVTTFSVRIFTLILKYILCL